MSKNCCNIQSDCCNNNRYNPCNNSGNTLSPFGGSWFYMLAILLLFAGGGFGPSSFLGDYNKIFSCSGFNNAWCNSIGTNNNFSTGNFSSNNLSNSNLAGLIGGLSGNSSSNINNITDSYN